MEFFLVENELSEADVVMVFTPIPFCMIGIPDLFHHSEDILLLEIHI